VREGGEYVDAPADTPIHERATDLAFPLWHRRHQCQYGRLRPAVLAAPPASFYPRAFELPACPRTNRVAASIPKYYRNDASIVHRSCIERRSYGRAVPANWTRRRDTTLAALRRRGDQRHRPLARPCGQERRSSH